MSDAKLKTRIKRFFKEEMEPKGYILKKARMPERFLAGLRQGIEFQPGTGHLGGQYTLNVFWSFMHSLDEGIAMHGNRRIGELCGEKDTWYSREESKLESDFEIVKEKLTTLVLPYLDKYSSIEKIIADASSGDLEPSKTFGISPGWRHFNQGYCYAFLGDRINALDHYQQVIEKYSDEPYEWVKKRKQAALVEISNLGG